jgi:hypothetical protein
MIKINEWDKVWSAAADGAAPSGRLIQAICGSLSGLSPQPRAVHFYRGEGLRWIRVGFDEERVLKPALVEDAGSRIRSCLAPSDPLYFQALRPHDLMFFLPGDGVEDSIGMPPRCFGLPLEEVLQAWA